MNAIAQSMGSTSELRTIPLAELHPHPGNPRFEPQQEVVDQIAAQLKATGSFDPAHALIVRPNADGFEVVAGHHRRLAAIEAGLEGVPCWVREMSDEDAYMALVLDNAQSELGALEEGMHALGATEGGKMTIRAYAERRGLITDGQAQALRYRVFAAKVVSHMRNAGSAPDLAAAAARWRALAEVHAAPKWLWLALADAILRGAWTVEATREHVARLKDIEPPPAWANADTIALDLVLGVLKVGKRGRGFAGMVEDAKADITRAGEDAERFCQLLDDALARARPGRGSEVKKIIQDVLDEQAALVRERAQADLLRTKREEEIAARLVRLRQNVTLTEWKTLAEDEQAPLLVEPPTKFKSFVKQDNDAIEWAQWSWNPVTGCLHDCPYCYARDIATSSKMATVYPDGFAPTLHPAGLFTPRGMKLPKEAVKDTRYRNVFTCSMADLFGRWVPREWIEATLREMRAAEQWNFLCLTKFPKRMAEFDIPPNVWMGTSVDLQARVANAEAAFANVNSKVRWLSIEPMIEPITFKHLDRFQWVVIGGASASKETPEWRPPFAWIADLVGQARTVGAAVYMKTNLGIENRILEMPFDAPIERPPQTAPAVFHYLGKGKRAQVEPT